jgi:hypothetical protein
MTKPTRVLARLRDADPVPETNRVHGAGEASALFSSILRRKEETMDVQTSTMKPQPVRPGPRQRRIPLLVGVSAIAVILAIAVPAALLRGGGAEPGEAPAGNPPAVPTTIELSPETPAPVVPSTIAVPATTAATPATDAPATTATPAPAPVASWTRVPGLEVFGRLAIGDVTDFGPGFVAVGSPAGELGSPTVLISPDGLTWDLLPDPEGVFDESVISMLLSRVDGTLVLIGNGFADDAVFAAAGWVSDDGLSWARIPDGSAIFDGGPIVHLVPGGPGLVAIGDDGAVMTSADGRSWVRTPEVFTPGSIADLEAGGPGLVAVGYAEGNGNDAAAWTSTDGVLWTRVVDDAAFGGPGNQWMDAVASGPAGLVAVGTSYTESGGARGAVWTSSDGVNWTRVPDAEVFAALLEGTGESTMNLLDVVAGGPGYVAVGAESATDQSVILVSSDGLTWTREPPSEIDIWVSSIIVEAGSAGVLVAGMRDGLTSAPTLVDMWILAP